MNKSIISVLITVLAVVLGYLVMVLLITLVQEGIFGGVSYYKSSLSELMIAGLGTMLAAVVGGLVAGFIAKSPKLTPQWIMAALTVVEATYLTIAGILDGPLWFDIISELGLIFGIIAGGLLGLQMGFKKQTT